MRKKKMVSTRRRPIAVPLLVSLAVMNLCSLDTAASNKDDKKEKPYAIVFGTAYGPDDRPLYGVHVTIHPAGKKHPFWDLLSDHRGEFAQRVPPGPGDYVVNGEIEIVLIENGKLQKSKKKRLKGEAKVHIDDQERHDFSLHMTE